MKWNKQELKRLKNITLDYSLDIDPIIFKDNNLINDINDCRIIGDINYNDNIDLISVDLQLLATMKCPCAISLIEVDYPIDISIKQYYSFDNNKEYNVIEIEKDILDLYPLILDNIILNIPLKVISDQNLNYPKGDGWQVIKEDQESNLQIKESVFDCLKDIKFDKEK